MLKRAQFDVIVIGGGINGVGIARDLSLRGIKCLLIEKHDFAHGASGNNTGMIHGGIRYLRYDVRTTKMACTDSGFIQQIASHLLFRVPFIFPVMPTDVGGRILLELAEIFFEAYDMYQPLKRGKVHTRLSREEALRLEPGLSPNMIGAVTLDEWGIDSFRLVVENAMDARDHGAQIKTYCEWTDFIRDTGGRISGIRYYDHRTRSHESAYAPAVINATGGWGPRISERTGIPYKLRHGKGIHVVYSHRVSNFGMLIAGVDGRQMFFLPHETSTWIGTTDDDFYGDMDEPPVLEDEVKYVIEGARHVFPSIDRYNATSTFVGVRPTIYEWGKNEDRLSREHAILDHARDGNPGLYSVTGGKLAAYRQLAEEMSDVVAKQLNNSVRCSTHEVPLPGARKPASPISAPSTLMEARLQYRHGTQSGAISDDADQSWQAAEEICLCEPVTKAEITQVLKNEICEKLCDLKGRTHLAHGACGGTHCVPRASQVWGAHKSASAPEQLMAMEEMLDLALQKRRSVLRGANLANMEMQRAGLYLSAGLGPWLAAARGNATQLQ